MNTVGPGSAPVPAPVSAPVPARILVVDDRAEGRKLLALRLQHAGYAVLQAEGGAQALDIAAHEALDLVLLDVLMPGMDGFEACRRLRLLPAMHSVPIVMVTALEATDDCVRGLEAGADDFIIKPFNPAELHARVRSLLRVKALFDESRRQRLALAEWSATLEQRVAAGVTQVERLSRLKRFLPPRLAERLVSEGTEAVLKHQRTEVTVLFADLRGFTRFAEQAEVEQVIAMLAPFHAAMGRLIFEAEGTLERFTGDGMMVFFNAPDAMPDHSDRALQLALDMQRAARALAEQWQRSGGPLGLAVGLARGPAAVGAVGFEGRQDYAAIGAATNLAARLCAEAGLGEVWLSASVRHAVAADFELQALAPLQLKGFVQPVQAWCCAGRSGCRSTSPPAAASG